MNLNYYSKCRNPKKQLLFARFCAKKTLPCGGKKVGMQKMKREIKYKILVITWIGALVAVMLSWGAALHDNLRRGRAEAKEVAVQTLRSVAERVVNQEFEGLGINYMFFGDNGKKSTTRKALSEAGEFEIVVDSLKEAQGLYSLESVGAKADMLNSCGKFPLEQICTEWKEETDARYDGAMCALSLKVHPLGSDGTQERSVGDETVIDSRYDLGTYYLDSMYTTWLTAYWMSGFWCCVDGTDALLWVLSGLFLFLLLAGGVFWVVRSRRNKQAEVSKEVATTCRIGECIFDCVKHTLTYNGETIACTSQSANLLLGFAKSPNLFLSMAEIDVLCHWSSDELGVKERRRTAISTLKKLLEVDKSIRIESVRGKGYQIVPNL